MKYTKLGNSDLTVSRICMGCMGFGDAGSGSWLEGERFGGNVSEDDLQAWIDGLK